MYLTETQADEEITLQEWVVSSVVPSMPGPSANWWRDRASDNELSLSISQETGRSEYTSIKFADVSLLSRVGRAQARAKRKHDNSSLESLEIGARQEPLPSELVSLDRRLLDLPDRIRHADVFGQEIDSRALRHARKFLRRFYLLLCSRGEPWYEPHLSSEGYGDVKLSWSYGKKSLSFSITDSAVFYLKVWGPNVDTEMEDGVVGDDSDLINYWQWMIS